jgi:hypothetical protein
MVKKIMIITVLILTGCVSQRPDISKEEWKTREFKSQTKEQVISAAREVIRLADPSDVKFENTLDGFNAWRTSTEFYVVQSQFESYQFRFIAQEKNGLTRSRLEIDEGIMKQSLLTLGIPKLNAGKPGFPYIYDLFYSRVEYLLSMKENWQKCDDAVSRVSAKSGFPNDASKLGMASLCGSYSDDNIPNSSSRKIELF